MSRKGSDIPLTAAWVAAAMNGAVTAGDGGREFTGVSIDTRAIRAGELFVAIRGERFDGADFAGKAVDAGAAGVVVPRGRSKGAVDGRDAVVIEVDDTVAALQSLAHRVRRESGARVVAITGSSGKTTTKEAAAEFLAAKYTVVRNRGNFNNHIGLPLSLVELRSRPDVAVVELGMNHAGEISTLVAIAEPDVRVWTNVGDAHLGFFDSVDAIADAKAEILERAASGTVVVANADDARIAARMKAFPGRVVTFGMEHEADVRAGNVRDEGVDGTSAEVHTPRGTVRVKTPLIGRGNLANVLAATAVALEFDVPLSDIAAAAGRLRPAAHRGEVIRLHGGITVIDDSYNANPTAVRTSLAVLTATPATRRVAVLGEMLELGSRSADLHASVGAAAAAARVDVLFAVGGDAAAVLAGAGKAEGIGRVEWFADSEAAAAATVGLVQSGDVVLVKGSRGVRTDRVVDRLRAERA